MPTPVHPPPQVAQKLGHTAAPAVHIEEGSAGPRLYGVAQCLLHAESARRVDSNVCHACLVSTCRCDDCPTLGKEEGLVIDDKRCSTIVETLVTVNQMMETVKLTLRSLSEHELRCVSEARVAPSAA
jgi:hypothetical protein